MRDDSAKRQELLRLDKQARLVRWLVVPFAFAQFQLYRPPEGLELPFNGLTLALAVSLVVVLTNLLSIGMQSTEDVRRLRVFGDLVLAVDCALAVGVVWLFSFDPQSALWAILILPVLEGAIRGRLRGALFTWAGCSVGYLARELIAPTFIDTAQRFRIDSVTYRLGIVFVVAAATGYLAQNLADMMDARISDHLTARFESDRRAELLHVVAQAGRAMSSLDEDQVLRSVVDACVAAGFEGSGIAMIDHERGFFSFGEYSGLPEELAIIERPADIGVVGEVSRTRAPVILDRNADWSGPAGEARMLGYRSVVASPIWDRDVLLAVLITGTRERDVVTAHELESLDLLASHAGIAMSTGNYFKERDVLRQQLEKETSFDPQTNLPNRALFSDRIRHCNERKEAIPSPTAVITINLDRFKKVNDSLGLQVGDTVIRQVAERLVTTAAPGDTVARLGGDDFAVLIEDPSSEGDVVAHAQRIVEDLAVPFIIDGQEVYITASLGIAHGQHSTDHPRDLLREADVAMYRSKERGGNRGELYRPVMTAHARRRMDLELDLRRALEREELLVHYQPAIEVKTGNVVGAETLVRWQHPRRGLLQASAFVPTAEDTGLIVQLGSYVLERACSQLHEWNRNEHFPRFPVAVNVSATEFGQTDFVDKLVRTLEAFRVPPEQLLLEVTESVVMRDDRVTNSQMRKLEETGIRLAIDDFGLGYSALSYLKRFNFSVLKIDKSFIADVATRETDQAIVRYVLALAGDLGIPVVAEGVETEEQLQYLRSVDCQYVQGYYTCRPLDAADLELFVAGGLEPASAPAEPA